MARGGAMDATGGEANVVPTSFDANRAAPIAPHMIVP